MSAEIVNLRRARKDRKRTEKATEAAANRALFGRTRAAREAEAIEQRRASRHLDGHRRDADDGESS